MRSPSRDDARARALIELSRAVDILGGHSMSDAVRGQFERYLDLLLLWNKAQRLTGFDSAADMIRGLFIDSLLFLPLLPARPIRMVDIGAGAGFPGVPLAIVDRGITVTLVEARRKRVSFLRSVQRELGLASAIQIAEGRAEQQLCDELTRSGLFDVAVARAAGPVDELVATALRYLKPGGRFIAAGPPPSALSDRPRTGGLCKSHVQDYESLGLRRAFWIATKPDPHLSTTEYRFTWNSGGDPEELS